MIRGIVITGILGFLAYAVLAMATPSTQFNSIVNGTSTNPVVAIFQAHFGSLQYVLQAVMFVPIFSCVLANVAVATRNCYSLPRDTMLPASTILHRVSGRALRPHRSIGTRCCDRGRHGLPVIRGLRPRRRVLIGHALRHVRNPRPRCPDRRAS